MAMLVGSGKLFDAQVIGLGSAVIHSTPGNISGKDQITFKIIADHNCTANVFYADGDPTNSNTQWYPSPTSGIASISLTANTAVSFQERINAGWVRINITQQMAVNPTVTASFDTKAEQ
jgi:hypothetical protein